MVVEESGLYKIPFSGADSESVQVDHHGVAVFVVEYIPDVRVSVDNARRQCEIKPSVFVFQPG